MRADQTELHKSRPMPTEESTIRLSDENWAKQREKASCFMYIKFNDGNKRGFWSNEWKKPYKLRHIGDAVNEQMWLFEKYFKRHTASAAIFDTRSSKKMSSENKIYQFQNGIWQTVNEFKF